MDTLPRTGMCRRVLVVVVTITMLCLLVPVGGGAANAPGESAAGAPDPGVDAPVSDRFRYAANTGGTTRTEADALLEQPTRERVYATIEATPGLSVGEITDAVPVTRSTVRYHVRILREAGTLEAASVAGTLRFAPNGTDAEVAATLQSGPTRAVVEAVAEDEPASVTEIAEATDRAPSTVSHHLSTLEASGIVDRERDGEAVLTTLTAETRNAIGTVGAEATED